MGTQSIAWWPTVLVLAVACFTDLRYRRIPNWLVLPFLLAGIVTSAQLHGWHGAGQSLAGVGLGLGIYGFFFWMGGMGMGDVKLCAAIGAWIGPEQLLFAMVVIAIAGGIMVLCLAAARGFLAELFKNTGSVVMGWKKGGLRPHPELILTNPATRKIPYAPAIAIGTLLSFFSR